MRLAFGIDVEIVNAHPSTLDPRCGKRECNESGHRRKDSVPVA
jgi:hypothetical protein